MADETLLVEAIKTATAELDEAREVVRSLANDLADVADVIEPILKDQADRIRACRMGIVAECQQTSAALSAFKMAVMHPSMLEAIERSERLLHACRELEEFRACGFLDAYIAAFTSAAR